MRILRPIFRDQRLKALIDAAKARAAAAAKAQPSAA